ncbi:hypothetical protein Tco_1229349 [Tanacetum coccineum]
MHPSILYTLLANNMESAIYTLDPTLEIQVLRCRSIQDVQSKVSDVILRKENPVEETNPEYEKQKRYILELEDHIAKAKKHANRLVKSIHIFELADNSN